MFSQTFFRSQWRRAFRFSRHRRDGEGQGIRKILTDPETQFAIYRETTALKQFDNKLIELCTLNRGHGGTGKKLAAMQNRIWMHFRSQRG